VREERLCSHGSCSRYSKKAKDILARYDLVPQPKIIEVDLRGA
jgi:hypothetical protein